MRHTLRMRGSSATWAGWSAWLRDPTYGGISRKPVVDCKAKCCMLSLPFQNLCTKLVTVYQWHRSVHCHVQSTWCLWQSHVPSRSRTVFCCLCSGQCWWCIMSLCTSDRYKPIIWDRTYSFYCGGTPPSNILDSHICRSRLLWDHTVSLSKTLQAAPERVCISSIAGWGIIQLLTMFSNSVSMSKLASKVICCDELCWVIIAGAAAVLPPHSTAK